MAQMPEPVAHGPELQAVEHYFNDGTFFERLQRRKAAVQRLESKHADRFDSESVLSLDPAGVEAKRDWLDHFGAHWLTPKQFVGADPAKNPWPTLRAGFLKGMQAAVHHPQLDVQLLWVCAQYTKGFSVSTGVADRVFIVMLTPPTPDSGGGY